MNILEIIEKKTKKQKLNKEEIEFFIKSVISKKITESQTAQMIKAIYFVGLDEDETYFLTKAMQNSGETIKTKFELSDKHSSGGVSDTTTFVVAGIAASLGIKMLKSSGKALGHTGGTADKIKCFIGYNSEMPLNDALKLLEKNNVCLISQSFNFAPADKIIYALREKINAIDSLPLIASSIMSKKLASGAQNLVLDIKCGDGAFVKNVKQAQKLANIMLSIGKKDGKKVCAIISNMNQPLGKYVGNSLEAMEAISALKGEKSNLLELSKAICEKLADMNGKKCNIDETIENGEAEKHFRQIIIDGGGNYDEFANKKFIPTDYVLAKDSGYVYKFDLEKLGYAVREFEQNKDCYGIKLLCQIGDKIDINQPIMEIYGKKLIKKYAEIFSSCVILKKLKAKKQKLILKVVEQ